MIDLVTGDQVFFGWIGITANDSMTLILSVRRTNNTHAILRGTVTGNGDRTRQATRILVPYDCVLVSCAVRQTAGTAPTQPGTTWVDAFVERDGVSNNVATLMQGYFYDGHDLSYPISTHESKAGPQGRIVTASTADPAAGSEIAAQAVPTGARWKLRSFRIQLVQGLTQTPRARLNLRNASAVSLALLESQAALAASTTVDFAWAVDGPSINGTTAAALVQNMPLPRIDLLASYDFITSTTGIGANSDYGVGTYEYEEFFA